MRSGQVAVWVCVELAESLTIAGRETLDFTGANRALIHCLSLDFTVRALDFTVSEDARN
jgi:hypothetical protein